MASQPRQDPLLDLRAMRLHHTVDTSLGTLFDASKASLEDLLLQVFIAPAGMIARHKDEGIVLIPRRKIRIRLRFDRPEIARHEVDHPRYPVLAL